MNGAFSGPPFSRRAHRERREIEFLIGKTFERMDCLGSPLVRFLNFFSGSSVISGVNNFRK